MFMVKYSPHPTGHSVIQEIDPKMKALLSSETVWATHLTTQQHIPAPLSELWVWLIRLISQSNPLCGHLNLHCFLHPWFLCISRDRNKDVKYWQETSASGMLRDIERLPLCRCWWQASANCRGKWEIRVRCFVASLQNLTVSVSFICVKLGLLHYGKNNT